MQNSLQSFIDNLAKKIFNQTLDEAHAKNICIKCSAPADTSDWTHSDIDEYLITGLCPDCFNNLADTMEQEDRDHA